MSQRKNSLVLSQTVMNRLNDLVLDGTYANVEDAANHIIISALTTANQSAVSGNTLKRSETALPMPQTVPESISDLPQDDSPLANFLAMDF